MNHFGNSGNEPEASVTHDYRRWLINESEEVSAHYIDFDNGYIKFWEITPSAGEQNFLVLALKQAQVQEIEEIR